MADSQTSLPKSEENTKKRLVICCDGTWMNSDDGYNRPSFWGGPVTLQVPSNVTRIASCFKHLCSDGTLQIISYESGVGTGSNILDTITGGAFGIGISERIREAYSFICANYRDGDDILLVGFSRGAFTARSVAGLIGNLGLLTQSGIEYFYPIFKDTENWLDDDYEDPFPTLPFGDKPKGLDAAEEYRTRLEKLGYTRVRQNHGKGELIKVKAVAVWDTVGSLGIPEVSWLSKLGLYGSNKEYKFYDTSLSSKIEHAFQALSLDEARPPFSPAVWERLPDNQLTTDLRQVWFPGNHGNVGGGWPDQGIANLSLAWMMDQLASIGAEFDDRTLWRLFQRNVNYYRTQRVETNLPWATKEIYEHNTPVRPWALEALKQTTGALSTLAGQITRTPGLYKQVDWRTNTVKRDAFLRETNERIHSSVRVRLACKGLGLNDKAAWDCPALLKNWRLIKSREEFSDPIPKRPDWEPNESELEEVADGNNRDTGRWVWEYCGPKKDAPPSAAARIMVEDVLGPYERYLLKLAGGNPNSYYFADEQPIPKGG